MRVIGLDSATQVASVAVVEDDKLLAELTFNMKKNHSERLMPMLALMLEEINLTLDDITGFAVAVGPGSFTGLRIGLATMKSLAYVKDKPILACTHFRWFGSKFRRLSGNYLPHFKCPEKRSIYCSLSLDR